MDNFLLSTKKVLAVCMETTAGGRNYSGGLGALYGDTTRTMLRMEADFLAVTPLYKNGYVQQTVTNEGVKDEYPHQDLSVDYEDTGIILSVPLLNREIKVKVWKNRVLGNHYGLDTSLPENGIFAEITNNLYGENGIGEYDGEAQRLMQEVILGVGAVKLCDVIGYHFDILHLNEGHGVFAALYMLSKYRVYANGSFEKALKVVRNKTVFTTHTPISAGNKSRPIKMILDLGVNQGLSYEELQEIGAYDHPEQFGSTVAALRLSKIANAVAFRHQATSHELWNRVTRSAPIIYIDNGVDIAYWQDPSIKAAYEELNATRLRIAHYENKFKLVKEIEKRNGVHLDASHIVIGFARRAIEYKRADLIFADLERFERLIEKYHLQIVFSGKTHPKDMKSKEILKRLYEMTEKYPQNVVFIQNYDAEVAGLMTKGCDVWLGNPLIPQEACSTSGMKAACNGVLNLSTPDGWWYKSARHKVNGWVIGESVSHDYKTDAGYLYDVLENEVLPTYYDDVPSWLKMMMASIYTAQEECGTERMCRDYYAYLYNAPELG
ncbi:MAG: alpha-glucan family phosphorylase [Clostridia bacterium]|nr:alpha-glucan family phosphorylase [Clostridia bacterium]